MLLFFATLRTKTPKEMKKYLGRRHTKAFAGFKRSPRSALEQNADSVGDAKKTTKQLF